MKMKKILVLLSTLTINSCLVSKFIKKTEWFDKGNKDCNGNLGRIDYKLLQHECNDESFI